MGTTARSHTEGKKPLEIGVAMRRIRKAVSPFPRAALFALAEDGHTSAFEILTACIISIRTRDEETIPCAERLFALGTTPEAIADLSVDAIDKAIIPSTFHEAKAGQIKEIARRTVEEFGGTVPCDQDVLLSFRGVGPKCANLVLGIACNATFIGVDIHVHRVTNRWGYVQAPTPEKTMDALIKILPRRYWVEINSLLVPFGKHICTGVLPHCSTCPVLEMCRQVGVEKHR